MSNLPITVVDKPIMDDDLLAGITLLAHIRKTPLILYGIFVELLRQCYSDVEDLPISVAATWNEDPSKTKMWIDTDYRWEDENPEFRPAIYVKLGDIEYETYTKHDTSLISVDLAEGEYHHQRIGSGSAQLIHVGRTRGESVIIAGSTLDYMDSLSVIIRDDFCFDTFSAKSIGSLSLDKESKERYRSAVRVDFSFQDLWSIKMESPKLKRVVINAGRGLIAGLQ